MPFREAFDCLWCGRAHRTRSTDDLEGWAGLCPDCVGRAGDNGFLRFRVRTALAERGAASRVAVAEPPGPGVAAAADGPAAVPGARTSDAEVDAETQRYYAARAPEYDEVYLRRGAASIAPLQDARFQAELDQATLWLDALPLGGEIVEIAAGTGWWSPLLAQKGELAVYDINPEPLDAARDRLVAHGLRAHLHVRDAWEPADRQVDAVFCGFWLTHVSRARLSEFLEIVRGWLRPGGRFALIDERASAIAGSELAPQDERQPRRLADGREFTIRKVAYAPDELREALAAAGFRDIELRETETHFVMGTAVRSVDGPVAVRP